MAFPTNPIYKLYKGTEGSTDIGVTKAEGNRRLAIPFATDNTDYAEYLEWVAAGNTAEAAD